MSYFLIALVVVLFFVVVLLVYIESRYKRKLKLPYQKKESLLTESENKFYLALSKALKDEYLIFAKVRLADVICLPILRGSDYYYYLNKIIAKHIDFLICEKENIKPVLAIELDDNSHLSYKRKKRDKFIDEVFKTAQLPILHIKNAKNYDSVKLNNEITNFINKKAI